MKVGCIVFPSLSGGQNCGYLLQNLADSILGTQGGLMFFESTLGTLNA